MTNFGVATNFKTRSSSVLVKQRQVQLCAWNLLKLYFLIHFLRPLALWNSSLPRRLLHSSGIPRHHPIFSSLFWGAETPSAGSSCALSGARHVTQALGPSHATLPVSPIRLTDRAERLALVSSTQRTAIEALRSTPAGTRWAVQRRRTELFIFFLRGAAAHGRLVRCHFRAGSVS